MALTLSFRSAHVGPASEASLPDSPATLLPVNSLSNFKVAAFRSGLFVAYTSVCVGQVFIAAPSSACPGLVGEMALLATATASSMPHLCSVGTLVYPVRACRLPLSFQEAKP